MSVLVMEPNDYSRIYTKMMLVKKHKTVDQNYSYVISQLGDNEIKDLIINLSDLNELSFNKRYNDTSKVMQSKFISFNYSKDFINCPYQFVKYLQCIRYNIETDSNKYTILLDKIINDILASIVCTSEQYNSAKWG